MGRFHPRSLLGQTMLAVAVTLLVVQALGAILVYRAQHESYETSMLNAAAFRLISETRHPRGHRESRGLRRLGRPDHAPFGGPMPRVYPIEIRDTSPIRPNEARDDHAEERLRRILEEQSFDVAELIVVHRTVGTDPVAGPAARARAQAHRRDGQATPALMDDHLLLVGVRAQGDGEWLVARVRSPRAINSLVQPLIVQTVIMYLVLIGVMALILRRITRPLAALTRRVEHFAAGPGSAGQLEPTGPEDMQRLIVAHNAMEARIVAMLDEKDVMLGAIGHDLKTPLAALRVRIESVEDDVERGRMAATIEDIVRTLDDILSLARVGRPSDPLERNELSALVASVVEEYEDMGEPVELLDTERMALELRPTWLRRALRNLIGNALRYGERARVSLEREGSLAVIRIDDDGPGIPDASIETMMDPFMRGDPSRSSATGGAGLGLALARAIADQHGGSLNLQNRRGTDGSVQGLTATLRIPLD